MANHRMLSIQLLRSKQLENLSDGAFRLYINLCASADDDGFIDNAEMVTRTFNRTLGELHELWESGLLIKFSTGIYLIKHWRVHNQIAKDRYCRTVFVEEMKLITWNDSTKYYQPAVEGYPNGLQLIANWYENSKDKKFQLTQFDCLPPINVNILYTKCIQSVSEVETQLRLSKDNIVKFNIAERSEATDVSNLSEEALSESNDFSEDDEDRYEERNDDYYSLSADMPPFDQIPF